MHHAEVRAATAHRIRVRFRYSTILTATLTFQAFVRPWTRTSDGQGIKFQNYDANGNQTTQTEQVTTALAKVQSFLVVNVVDTGSNDAAQNIINQAKERNVPVIFFNRSVEESVVSSYDKCVFVGTDYEMGRTYAGRNDRQIPG